ncbi:hypothetical protein JX266_000979 [Neoarthrinium moseri]|uniref:uncharacterized protein n=1 Tax=Neoarthrinium moseri TaxID=1658444 RepID=UPI001FDE14C7|nr:uncharacterized protein JN550_000314 [Neoarthrinium moseri]KAI1854861.1 hypothetical protein JX266_000979 [Neoarthrinium moseri]KAI1878132.1 hypothetical protein JN550_000314 [Neoarthrinium moseri]
MALVDYSDSESDSEAVVQPPPKPAPAPASATAKKPIQRVVDRSNPRRIVVSLSGAGGHDDQKPREKGDEPPAKRARTGGGAFGGFASLLPPPKNPSKPAAASSAGGASASVGKSAPPRVGVNLKTGAAPGFSRSNGDDGYTEDGESASKQPSIPEGQKPAEEVKLVGKPLMFRPLSVSRKPKKAANTAGKATKNVATTPSAFPTASTIPEQQLKNEPPPAKKKKVSLFSISAETDADAASDTTPNSGAYEPMFMEDAPGVPEDFSAYDAQNSSAYSQPAAGASKAESLDTIASDMNLSAAARRELFGRRGAPAPSQSATKVINFNTDQEYAHNEELRASGEQQIYNPVRAIAPGKHSLRQLVTQVHNQKDALEESFAKGKSNQNAARSRYGW